MKTILLLMAFALIFGFAWYFIVIVVALHDGKMEEHEYRKEQEEIEND